MNDRTFRFEDWETALWETVASEFQGGYREAIVKFRYWLRQTRNEPGVEAFKDYLEWKQTYLPPNGPRFDARLCAGTTRREVCPFQWMRTTGGSIFQHRSNAWPSTCGRENCKNGLKSYFWARRALFFDFQAVFSGTIHF